MRRVPQMRVPQRCLETRFLSCVTLLSCTCATVRTPWVLILRIGPCRSWVTDAPLLELCQCWYLDQPHEVEFEGAWFWPPLLTSRVSVVWSVSPRV